ncbi:MAG: sulfatase [Candidatus Hydrogenedentota bacterium]
MIARATLAATLVASAFAAERPNIIIVLADDFGYGDIAANAETPITTPNLDRMAAEGARLTSFYSSANVCTPSRAGLLTGRYPARAGLAKGVVFPNNSGGLAPEEVTLAEVLSGAGYATAMVGKWHLGNRPPFWPTSAGFGSFFGTPYSNDMTPFPLYRDETMLEPETDQHTITERYVAETVHLIETLKDGPFFIYLAHNMPHVPLFVSDRFKGKSAAGLYGDVIETIDWGMGEILAALDKNGIDENTLVLFTSDNGPWFEGSSGEYRDRKGSSWEGGQRVPLIARWPKGIPKGTVSDAISMNIDLLPTLAGLAGAALPADRVIDGRDILPLLRGEAKSPHESLYLFNEEQIAAVRTPDWKLVIQSYYKQYNVDFIKAARNYEHGLLFDMRNDPQERYSLTRDHEDVVSTLGRLYTRGVDELVNSFVDRRDQPK